MTTRNRVFSVAILTGVIVACASWARTRYEGQAVSIVVRGVHVSGSRRFAHQIKQALDLLSQKAPGEFLTIQDQKPSIRQADRSSLIEYTPPVIEMSAKSALYSLTWCAGAIAHESMHLQRYIEHGITPEVADTADKVRDEELICLRYQARVLRAIGAPALEINDVESANGRHNDTNGDGLVTWEDYVEQDW
jgi:hypothetical protein